MFLNFKIKKIFFQKSSKILMFLKDNIVSTSNIGVKKETSNVKKIFFQNS